MLFDDGRNMVLYARFFIIAFLKGFIQQWQNSGHHMTPFVLSGSSTMEVWGIRIESHYCPNLNAIAEVEFEILEPRLPHQTQTHLLLDTAMVYRSPRGWALSESENVLLLVIKKEKFFFQTSGNDFFFFRLPSSASVFFAEISSCFPLYPLLAC